LLQPVEGSEVPLQLLLLLLKELGFLLVLPGLRVAQLGVDRCEFGFLFVQVKESP